MNMCIGATKGKDAFFVSEDTHPQTIGVIETRARAVGINVVIGNPSNIDFSSNKFCGVLVSYPTTFGNINDYTDLAKKCKETELIRF